MHKSAIALVLLACSTSSNNDAGVEGGYPAGSCPATCTSTLGAGHAFTSKLDVAEHLTGKWLTCAGGTLGFIGAAGIEFTDNGEYYVLYGSGTRGASPNDKGTYVIGNSTFDFDNKGNFGLYIKAPLGGAGATYTYLSDGYLSDCPRMIRLGDGPQGKATQTTTYAAAPL